MRHVHHTLKSLIHSLVKYEVRFSLPWYRGKSSDRSGLLVWHTAVCLRNGVPTVIKCILMTNRANLSIVPMALMVAVNQILLVIDQAVRKIANEQL